MIILKIYYQQNQLLTFLWTKKMGMENKGLAEVILRDLFVNAVIDLDDNIPQLL